MPVHPRPADIDNYNAWAIENNRPLWHEHLAPAAEAPAPVPAPAAAAMPHPVTIQDAVAHGTRAYWNETFARWEISVQGHTFVLTTPRGTMTDAGGIYTRAMRAQGVESPHYLLRFRPGVELRGNSMIARDLKGHAMLLSRWNAHTDRYDATKYGASYFQVFKTEFTVNVPIYRVKIRNEHFVKCAHQDPNLTLPITDDAIRQYLSRGPMPFDQHLGDLRIVPANATPERQREWIVEAFQKYIAEMPREDGHIILSEFVESDLWNCYDTTRQPTFDDMTVHVQHAGTVATQLVLNRPLRGVPIAPEDFYMRTGIMPIAWTQGGVGEHNCVLNQLISAITYRKDTRKRVRRMVDGERVTVYSEAGGGRTNEPKYDKSKMMALVDKHFELRYPRVNDKRPEPYEGGDWKTTGITSHLVVDICKAEGIAVHILHSSRLIQTFKPEGWKSEHNACICFNVWSDHAFFYDGSNEAGKNAKAGISRMRPVTASTPPPHRLVFPGDDDDRTDYVDMEPFTLEAFEAAVKAKKAKEFYTENIEEALKLAAEKHQCKKQLGSKANELSRFSVYLKNRDKDEDTKRRSRTCVKVKAITHMHKRLYKFVETFRQQAGLKLEYKGEAVASMVHRMVCLLLVAQRRDATKEDILELKAVRPGGVDIVMRSSWKRTSRWITQYRFARAVRTTKRTSSSSASGATTTRPRRKP